MKGRRTWFLALAALVVAAIAAILLRDGEASVAVRANSVAVVDPDTGRVVDDIPGVGTRPGPIAFGAGSIWVGNLGDDRTVTRIDPNRRTVLRNIGLEGRTPTGLAFGFRVLWVAHGRRGEVSSIDPQFNEPSEPIPVADTAFGSPNGSVTIGEDSVWAAFGDGTLARIEPVSGRVESARAGQNPAGIVVGSGSVWVSNYGDANSVVRSDIRVQAGKLTDVTVSHRAAVITLKLVSDRGGEALANTAWSVITPGGDVIKESIGAFPRVVLSEGEYRAIAKNEGKVFERPFNVVNGVDGEVEVIAR